MGKQNGITAAAPTVANTAAPYLIWAGSKWTQRERIHNVLPSNRTRLIEPFFGSGAVGLTSKYQMVIGNDTNRDLIHLHRMVKEDIKSTLDAAARLLGDGCDNQETFNERRAAYNESADPDERAILFLYLNRLSHNGLCRYNKSGKFNAPFGHMRVGSYTNPVEQMIAFSKWAKRAFFVCSDFREIMQSAGRGDVVYLDPPYWPLSPTANFTAYGASGFNQQDQIDLADAARAAADRGAFVAISNNRLPETMELYEGAQFHTFTGARMMGNQTGKNRAAEMIATWGG